MELSIRFRKWTLGIRFGRHVAWSWPVSTEGVRGRIEVSLYMELYGKYMSASYL